MIRGVPVAVVAGAGDAWASDWIQPCSIPLHLADLLSGGDGLSRRAGAASSRRRGHLTGFYLGGWRPEGPWAASSTPWSPRSSSTGSPSTPGAVPGLPGLAGGATEGRRSARYALDVVIPLGMGMVLWGLVHLVDARPESPQSGLLAKLLFSVAAVACFSFKDRPSRFALGIGAVLAHRRGIHRRPRPTFISASQLFRRAKGHGRRGGKIPPPDPRPHPARTAESRARPAARAVDVLRPHRTHRAGL